MLLRVCDASRPCPVVLPAELHRHLFFSLHRVALGQHFEVLSRLEAIVRPMTGLSGGPDAPLAIHLEHSATTFPLPVLHADAAQIP